MRAYIIRRLLLMIPTLFGVTLVTFVIIKLAPGDPLRNQLSQTGAQGESSVTREAYLLQRRQWKLDKPVLLNTRWFKDYTAEAFQCARLRGMSDEEIASEIEGLASRIEYRGPGDPAMLSFLRGLGIESFDRRLRDPQLRGQLLTPVKIGVQIRVENMSEQGVRFFTAILRGQGDTRLKIGAVRCLAATMLGDPFTYTYSKDPRPDETDAVTSTWRIWWDRERGKFGPLSPERAAEVRKRFQELVGEPSRSKILEGMSSFSRQDAPFFVEKLLGDSGLREKYVASLALRSWIGRPLRVDVKLTDSAEEVERVASNWLAYYESHRSDYDPSLPAKIWYLFADTQYANSLARLVTFSFGKSMVSPYDPVSAKIWDAVKVSVWLMLLAELVVYLVAIPSGILCAIRRGRWQDKLISLILFILYSVPVVVACMIFLTLLCYGKPFKLFPMYGLHSEDWRSMSLAGYLADYLWHVFLPVICLSVFSMAGLAMYSRTSMLDVVNQDYIRTARAKGLPERAVVLKHALRNALIPVITLFSNFLPALLGGSVVVEWLFGIPGMGRLSFDSILAKDYNTLMALIYIDAVVVMVSILITDLLYVVVDPRITFEKAGAGR